MELGYEKNGSVCSMCIKHCEIKAENVSGLEIFYKLQNVELMNFIFWDRY
jgi:hypothetical protein